MEEALSQMYDQFGLPLPQAYDQFGLPVGSCEIPSADEQKWNQLVDEMDADPLHGALKIAVTPAQIAAAFEHETLDNDAPRMTTRLFGAVRMLGAFVEGSAAAALAAAPEPTMLTKVASVGVGLYAADQFATSLDEMWTGRYQGSNLSRGVAAGARALGANNTTADGIGIASEMIVPIGATAYLRALRLAAVKAGRFSIAIHEAPVPPGPGGHTILKHVGKDADYLVQRWRDALALFSRSPRRRPAYAYSSFRSVGEAEKFISQGLVKKRAEIEAWAKTAPVGAKKPFDVDFGAEIVGWGVAGRDVSTADKIVMARFTKIRIVIKKEPFNGKLMFILSCFPIP